MGYAHDQVSHLSAESEEIVVSLGDSVLAVVKVQDVSSISYVFQVLHSWRAGERDTVDM